MKKIAALLAISVLLFSCGKQPDKELQQPHIFRMQQDDDSCRRQPDLYWCRTKDQTYEDTN